MGITLGTNTKVIQEVSCDINFTFLSHYCLARCFVESVRPSGWMERTRSPSALDLIKKVLTRKSVWSRTRWQDKSIQVGFSTFCFSFHIQWGSVSENNLKVQQIGARGHPRRFSRSIGQRGVHLRPQLSSCTAAAASVKWTKDAVRVVWVVRWMSAWLRVLTL